jgi:predicted transcriptional regulator
MHGRIILLVIAVFIYMAASSEELMVDVKATLKKFRVKDILPSEFLTLQSDATFSKVLELIFHSHQEDFPVINETDTMIGFITRGDVINGIHQHGVAGSVSSIMRTNVPEVSEYKTLDEVQNIMQGNELKALPVLRDGKVVGVITTDDISRVYSMMSRKK